VRFRCCGHACRLTGNGCSLVSSWHELQALTGRRIRRSSKWCAGWKWADNYQGSLHRDLLFSAVALQVRACIPRGIYLRWKITSKVSLSLERTHPHTSWWPTWVFCPKATTLLSSSESLDLVSRRRRDVDEHLSGVSDVKQLWMNYRDVNWWWPWFCEFIFRNWTSRRFSANEAY